MAFDKFGANGCRDASSLSDLKEIGCKIGGTGHISSLFWAIE
jgi:hypothetical protein